MSYLFSDRFEVAPEVIEEYGAVDISLICDLPLFIDPLLIFNSSKKEYKNLHEEIIKYFYFLAKKALTVLTKHEILAWFTFHEVKQNWLGYCFEGNGGLALGEKFAEHLYGNVGFLLENNNISKGRHVEKVMLLYEGSGKDKISDLTVNLIKGFFLEYTQEFASRFINPKFIKALPVENAFFNYDTETFASREYNLPYVINKKGNAEYVLLTPIDMLREKEPAINRDDFYKSHERIRGAIDDNLLKALVENAIAIAVKEYEEKQKANKRVIREASIAKIERLTFKELVKEYPILSDYYILLKENDKQDIREECKEEADTKVQEILKNAQKIIEAYWFNNPIKSESMSAREEAKRRIEFFKHVIEDCDAYRNFYVKGKTISRENDLQRMFKLVWYGTDYSVNFEVNNGRGPADVIVSKSKSNKCIIEFKLAKSLNLKKAYKQVEIYEETNVSKYSLIAIFYFTQEEFKRTEKQIKALGLAKEIGESIFLIDCRNDNKPSASKAK